VKRFRGGLVFKTHRHVYHSTLGLIVMKKKKKVSSMGGRIMSVCMHEPGVQSAKDPCETCPTFEVMTVALQREKRVAFSREKKTAAFPSTLHPASARGSKPTTPERKSSLLTTYWSQSTLAS